MRTFIAVRILPPGRILNVLNESRSLLSPERIKWVEPGNIHLTLKFLGDTPEEYITLISREIRRIAGNYESFHLTFRGMGVFRDIRNPRVIWVGIEDSTVIVSIQQDVEQALTEFGYPPEERDFHPHLTLGRINYLRDRNTLEELLDRYQNYDFQGYTVNKIVYYRSILKKSGPEYLVLSEASLKTRQ